MEHRGNDHCGYCGKIFTPSAYQCANKARGHATYCTRACMCAADRVRQQAHWAWHGIEIGHCGRWHRVRGLPVVCAVCGVVILAEPGARGIDPPQGEAPEGDSRVPDETRQRRGAARVIVTDTGIL